MWVEFGFGFGLLYQLCNFFFRINALEEQIESQKVTTGKQVEEESIKHKLALVGFCSFNGNDTLQFLHKLTLNKRW